MIAINLHFNAATKQKLEELAQREKILKMGTLVRAAIDFHYAQQNGSRSGRAVSTALSLTSGTTIIRRSAENTLHGISPMVGQAGQYVYEGSIGGKHAQKLIELQKSKGDLDISVILMQAVQALKDHGAKMPTNDQGARVSGLILPARLENP